MNHKVEVCIENSTIYWEGGSLAVFLKTLINCLSCAPVSTLLGVDVGQINPWKYLYRNVWPKW